MSNSLQPREPQHVTPLFPLPTPRVCPNPCPLSWWCHPTIWSSVVSFPSCPQSFPASGSFQTSQLFASGGKVLEFQFQHQSFQWTPGLISFTFLKSGILNSLLSKLCISMALWSVIRGLLWSFGGVFILWFFIFLEGFCCCLHIWSSNHLSWSLSTYFGKEIPSISH